MRKKPFPEAGTALSVEWHEAGPKLTINGSSVELAVSLAFLIGALERNCKFPHTAIKTAAETGAELFDIFSNGSVTVDLVELAKQAKEGGECASES